MLGACLAFAREGYRFRDISLCDLWDYATNGGLWKFAVSNPRLSLGEIYRDLNKRAFLREAQKLVPSVTEDMVEESFSGVMAQVIARQLVPGLPCTPDISPLACTFRGFASAHTPRSDQCA